MKFSLSLVDWIDSFRLKTLPLALSAIFVGNSLAYSKNEFSYSIAFLSIITASLLQILSNLANDYGDAVTGADQHNRIGPKRPIQNGAISMQTLRLAIIVITILSIIAGGLLIFIACRSTIESIGFILLGALAIIAAITYTIGKTPYGYRGFGDISVLIFFGFVSVIGSYYLQTKSINIYLLFPAIGCGLLSVAVLNINNLRDIESDKKSNKRTLIVIFGDKIGRYYHVLLLIMSILFLGYFSNAYLKNTWGWLFLIALPYSFIHLKEVLTYRQPKDAAPLLIQIIKITLLNNLLYSIGIVLS